MSGHEVKENSGSLSTSRQKPRRVKDPAQALQPSSAGQLLQEGPRLGDPIKGYTLGSFLKRSSHLRLASIMPWMLLLPTSETREWGRCRRRSCSLGTGRRGRVWEEDEGRQGARKAECVAGPAGGHRATSSLFLSVPPAVFLGSLQQLEIAPPERQATVSKGEGDSCPPPALLPGAPY